jgi:hypothetical protein
MNAITILELVTPGSLALPESQIAYGFMLNWWRVSAPLNTSGTGPINQRDRPDFALLHACASEGAGR